MTLVCACTLMYYFQLILCFYFFLLCVLLLENMSKLLPDFELLLFETNAHLNYKPKNGSHTVIFSV